MSCTSPLSSSRDMAVTTDLKQEIEAVRNLNSSLRVYLENLRTLRKDLQNVNKNCKQLIKVNSQWIDTINMMK